MPVGGVTVVVGRIFVSIPAQRPPATTSKREPQPPIDAVDALPFLGP
jgi:hypothetical protein